MAALAQPGTERLPPRRRRLLLLGTAVLALGLQVAGFHPLRHDDAYITYRYGQNLASGEGLVFNPGERLMGSTSPGHALLSAGVYAVVGRERLPAVMAAVGCLGWTVHAVLLFLLLEGALGGLGAGLVASCFAAGAAWSFEWVALETDLAAAAVTAALLAGVRGRWTWAAGLLAVAGLLRPDAYLAGLPLGFLALPAALSRTTPIGPPLLAFGAITAPWFLFAKLYFGSVLPQSAVAKVGRATAGEYLLHLLRDPARVLWPGAEATWPWVAATWLLTVLGSWALISRQHRLWVLPAYGALHFAAYLVLRPFIQHRWHLYPLVWVVVVLALAAVASVSQARPARIARPVAAVALLGLLALYGHRSWLWTEHVQSGYWWGQRDRVYRRVAEYLLTHGDPATQRVATVEVGTLAYYGGFRMLDLGGLVTRLPEDPADWPPVDWLVVDRSYLQRIRGREPVTVVREVEFTAYVFDARRPSAADTGP